MKRRTVGFSSATIYNSLFECFEKKHLIDKSQQYKEETVKKKQTGGLRKPPLLCYSHKSP